MILTPGHSAGLGLTNRRAVVTNVATPSKAPTSRAAKRSKVEIIKEVRGNPCAALLQGCSLRSLRKVWW